MGALIARLGLWVVGWVCLAAGAGQAADGGGTAAKHVLQVHGVVARGNADGSFVVDADRVLIHPAGREARFAPTRRKVVRLAVPGRLLDPAGESLPASRIREGAEVEALGPDEGVGAVLDAGIVVVHTAPAAGWCDLRSLAARPRAVRAVAPTPPLSRTSEPAAIGRPTVVHPTQRLSRAAARRVGGAASAQRAAHASRGTVLLTAPAWPAGGVCVARPAGSAMVARAAPARLHLPRTYPALTAFVLPAGGALADEGAHRVSPHAVPQHVFAPAADATAPRPAVPADARPIASAAPARGGGVPAFSLWAGVGSAPALRAGGGWARLPGVSAIASSGVPAWMRYSEGAPAHVAARAPAAGGAPHREGATGEADPATFPGGAGPAPDSRPDLGGLARERYAERLVAQSAIRFSRFRSGSLREKVVTLTFDDGPHPVCTPRILDTLRQEGVPATFFVVGMHARQYPEIVEREVAEGHDVGNHTYHHYRLATLDARGAQAEIELANRALEGILGGTPRWFRAPGCRYTPESLEVLRRLGMVRVDASANSDDFLLGTACEVVDRALRDLQPGAVILCHDRRAVTVEALPHLIHAVRAQGYRFVPLAELMASSQ